MSSVEENIRDININRLLEGYQYGDLPEDYLLGKYKDNLSLLIDDIFDKNNLYDVFKFDDDGLIDITKLKNCENPMYIHMDGAEPISFFDFKKNGVYREIQIPNLIYLMIFLEKYIMKKMILQIIQIHMWFLIKNLRLGMNIPWKKLQLLKMNSLQKIINQ